MQSLSTSVIVQGDGSSWINGDQSHGILSTVVDNYLTIPGQSGVYIPIPVECSGWNTLQVSQFLNFINVTPADLSGGIPRQLSFYKDQQYSYTPVPVLSTAGTWNMYYFVQNTICTSTSTVVQSYLQNNQYWFGLQSSQEQKVPNFIKKNERTDNKQYLSAGLTPFKFIGVSSCINHNTSGSSYVTAMNIMSHYNTTQGQLNKRSFMTGSTRLNFGSTATPCDGVCISDGTTAVFNRRQFGHLTFGCTTNTDYCQVHSIRVQKFSNGVSVSVPHRAHSYSDANQIPWYTIGSMYNNKYMNDTSQDYETHPFSLKISELNTLNQSLRQNYDPFPFRLSQVTGYEQAGEFYNYTGVQNTMDVNSLPTFDSLFIWNPFSTIGGKNVELQVYKVVFTKVD